MVVIVMKNVSVNQRLLEEAVESCSENAEQYLKDAEILIAFRSYGHAYGLVVLAEEEFGNAVIYHLCSIGLLPAHLSPEPLSSYIKNGMYEELAKQTWTMGLAISSSIDMLIDSTEKSLEIHARTRAQKTRKIAKNYKQVLIE